MQGVAGFSTLPSSLKAETEALGGLLPEAGGYRERIVALVSKAAALGGGQAGKAKEAQQPAEAEQLESSFLSIKEVSCVSPRGKFQLEVAEDAILFSNKRGGLKVSRDKVAARLHVNQFNSQNKPTRGLIVLVLRTPLLLGKTKVPAIAMAAPTVVSRSRAARSGRGAEAQAAEEALAIKTDVPLTARVSRPADASKFVDGSAASGLDRLMQEGASGTEQVWPMSRVLLPALTSAFGDWELGLPAIFRASSGATALSCNMGVRDGWLWPLASGLLFGPSGLTYISFSQVSEVVTQRIAGGGRTFDLAVVVDGSDKPVEFGQIPRKELGAIQTFVSEREFGKPAAAAAAAATTDASQTDASGEEDVDGGSDDEANEDSDEDSDEDGDFEAADADDDELAADRRLFQTITDGGDFDFASDDDGEGGVAAVPAAGGGGSGGDGDDTDDEDEDDGDGVIGIIEGSQEEEAEPGVAAAAGTKRERSAAAGGTASAAKRARAAAEEDVISLGSDDTDESEEESEEEDEDEDGDVAEDEDADEDGDGRADPVIDDTDLTGEK